jgi:lysophospholipase L1-like esterase
MGLLRKLGRVVRDTWLVLGVTLLLLVVVEGCFSAVIALRTGVRKTAAEHIDDRVRADTYPDSAWVKEYFTEFHASSDVFWRPYVYWRRNPYRGRYVNVDRDGLRVTPPAAQPASQAGPPLKVYMFGGSTLWGTGARDQFTIPARLARQLQDRGIAAEVTNFGESGYVSTQEIVQLLVLLQSGRVPDLAIFYDGVNDTFSALQQRRAGIPQNEFNRAREFNLTQGTRYSALASGALSGSATLRVLSRLQSRLGLRPARQRAQFDRDSLAVATVELYRSNLRLVKALAEAYGFRALFFWQPTIFGKDTLTRYEAVERLKQRDVEGFFAKAYAAVPAIFGGEESFRDLSGIFAGETRPLYIDWSHLGESGNELVAARMVDDVARLAREGRPAPRTE